jgi:hypothetical protein
MVSGMVLPPWMNLWLFYWRGLRRQIKEYKRGMGNWISQSRGDVMDSNYEVQKHYVSQRLVSRREQGIKEQMVKVGRTKQMGTLRHLLTRLLRRPDQKRERIPSQRDTLVKPALHGGRSR